MRGMKKEFRRVLAMIMSLILLTGQAEMPALADEYISSEELSAYLLDEAPDEAGEDGTDTDELWEDDVDPGMSVEEDVYESVIADSDADPVADPAASDAEVFGEDIFIFDAEEPDGDVIESDPVEIGEEMETDIPETGEEQAPDLFDELPDEDDPVDGGLLKAGQESDAWARLRTALQGSGSITLSRDYTAAEGDSVLVIPEDRSVVLNLNGHTISSGTTQNLFEVYGTLLLQGPGTLSLQDGSHTVYVGDGGNVDMQGGTITSDHCLDTVFLCMADENAYPGMFSMSGGTITGTNFQTDAGYPACSVYDAGIFVLMRGTVSGSGIDLCAADNGTLRLNSKEVNGIEISSIFLDTGSGDGPVVQIDSSMAYLSPIEVSVENLPEAGDARVITWGLRGRGSAENFVSADPAYAVRTSDAGEAQLMLLHDVSIDADIEDGTVTADTKKACAGDLVSLTITPDAGYDLVELTVDGEAMEATQNDDGGYGCTFTMPGNSVVVRAVFDTCWAALKDRLAAGGTVTLDQDYTAQSGDAVLEVLPGTDVTLDLNGHSITGYRGMRSVLEVSGNLTLKDGEENKEESGELSVSGVGGYYTADVLPGGSFIMEGGSITGAGGRRCAVFVEGNARFIMNGGSITGEGLNTTVLVFGYGDEKGSFTMSDGLISGTDPLETAAEEYAGDVVANEGDFTMTGGSITGGVRCLGTDADRAVSTLTISGSPKIAKVFLRSGARIRIGGELTLTTSEAIAVDVSPMPTDGSPYVFTRGLKDDADAKFFTGADENYAVRTNADGEAQLVLMHSISVSDEIEYGSVTVTEPDSAKACPGDHVTVSVEPADGYALRSLSYSTDGGASKTAFTPEDGFIMPDADVTVYGEFDDGWSMLRSLMAKGGDIRLTKSYTAAAGDPPLEVPAGVSVTLDLNGRNIDRGLGQEGSTAVDDGFVIINNGTLTITDDNGPSVDGIITGGNNTGNGGGIVNNGTLTLLRGQVTGNKAGESGGGIYNSSDGSLTVTGGIISFNTAQLWHGGGIYNDGTLTLSGGRIENNKALGEGGSGQGGGILQNGTMNVSGNPRVVNNTALQGNNLYLRSAHPVMNVAGSFTSGASLYVRSGKGTGVITSGYATHNSTADPGDFFTAEGAGYIIYKTEEGEAKIQKGSAVARYVERSWDAENKQVVFDLKDTDAADPVPDDGAMTSGWYYLNKNITVNKRICLTGDTDLILGDGKTLNVKGLYVPAGSTLNIYSETVNGTGVLISKPGRGAGIGAYSGHKGGSIVIHGGRIEAEGGDNCAGIGSNDGHKTTAPITIYGGGITAQGGENGAGIGGGRGCDGGKITIYGGTVYTRGGSDAAGIGGGEDADGGEIVIWGGTITANDDPNENAAAIGGGNNKDGGHITINGGTIHTWSRDGACIGGGEDGDGGKITINGGSVTCEDKGNAQGARIGGGNNGDGGHITINRGTVKVYFRDGAGIGGGEDGDSGTILITGGDITSGYADGSKGNAAAIGGGNHDGNGEDITITGGTVHANSNGGAGIGGGRANDTKTTQEDQNSGDGGNITITGGTVYASSEWGHGIGAGGKMGKGGFDSNPDEDEIGSAGHIIIGGSAFVNTWGALAGIGGDDGYVKITGGIVNTYGSNSRDCGCGIKMEDRDGHGNVYISGGKVTARGYGEWPAISAEREGKVYITGGSVDAYAPKASAIGSRYDDDTHHRMTGSIKIEGKDTYVKAVSDEGAPIGDHWDYPNNISFGPGITLDLVTGKGKRTGVIHWFCKNNFFYAGARYTAGLSRDSAKILPAAERNKAYLNEKELYYYLHVEPCTHAGTMQGGTCSACGYRMNSRKYIERRWDGEKVVSEEKDSPDSTASFPDKEDDLAGGWYYLDKSVTIKHRVCFVGDTNLILKDGVTFETRGLYVPEGCTLTIYGETEDCSGKIVSIPTGGGTGIGGYENHTGGNIVIHGGYIEAVGDNHCAGIGSNDGQSGTVNFTMYGGNVTAVGGSNGAGIGGGRECDAGVITIYGGTVTAIGKNDAAAIGGGDSNSSSRGNASDISIYGGDVTATAAGSGASIGGADYGTAKVSIYGGLVTALHTGGSGVGIGGGSKITPDTSTITLGYTDLTKDTMNIQAGLLGGSVKLEKPFRNGAREYFVPGPVPENKKAAMARSVLTPWDFEVMDWELLQYALSHTDEGGRIVLNRDIKAGPEDRQLEIPEGASITLDLNGHTIDRGVTADYGVYGGRVMTNRGILTIRDSAGGGMITGGRERSNLGGGILNFGTLELKRGTVTGNWVYGSGGGIYNAGNGVFFMTGGLVSENIAYGGNGAGIYNEGYLELSGGTITGNEAQALGASRPCGGGLYNNGTLYLSGDPAVKDNIAPYSGNNIFFADGTKAKISDELTNSEPIGVYNLSGTFTEGLSGNGTAENFISDREGYAVGTDADGEAYLGEPVVVTFRPGDPAATGEMLALHFAKNSGYTLPACRYVVEDRPFLTWSVQIGSDAPVFMAPGETITLSADTTLTAVWKKHMAVEAEDEDVVYDGEAYGILVKVTDPVEGYTITYGLEEGVYDLNESPTAVNVSDTPLMVCYKVTAPGYIDVTGSAEVTIQKRSAYVMALPQTVKVNGSIDTGLSAALLGGQIVRGHVLNGITLSSSSTEHVGTSGMITPSNAVIVDALGVDVTANYAIQYAEGRLTVEKGDPSVTAPEARTDLVYSGQAQELVTGGSAAGGALQYSFDGETWSASVPTAISAGEYTVYYRADETDDYCGSEPLGPVVARIKRAPLEIAAEDRSITYGDVPTVGGVTYTGFVNGETEAVLGGVLSCNCGYEQFGDVGTYAIEPAGLTSDNYEIVFKPGVLTVLPKTVGLTWDNKEYTYDGSVQGPTATAVETVNGDAISVIVDGAQKDAGTGYVAEAIALTGNKAGNYALPSANPANQKTFSIKKAVWPQAKIDLDLVYTATAVTASMAGRMPEDAGKLTYEAGTPSPPAGHVQVTSFAVDDSSGYVTATLSGGAVGDTVDLPVAVTSGNYEDTVLHLTVWLVDKDKTGVTITGGGVAEGKITKTFGDPGFVLNAAAEEPGSNGEWEWTSSDPSVAKVTGTAGTAEVTVQNSGSTILTARYSSNETFGLAEVVLFVEPKSIEGAQVSVGGSYIYNGMLQKPADSDVTVYLDGEKLTGGQDYTLETTGGPDAGAVGLTVLGNGNYTGSVSGSFTIAPAPLTITTGSAQKAYDGKALINTQKSLSGLANGETVTVDVTGSQTEVGSSENSFTVMWETGTAKASNYELTEIPGKLEVSKNAEEIILAAASDSKIYDGTALVNASVAAIGLPEGFTVDATVEGSQTNAGTCANVIQDGYKILNADGEDKTANFTKVKRVDGTLTVRSANITGAKVTLNPDELSYNGQEQSVAVTKVELDGVTLTAGSDYDVTGVTGKDVDIYTATVTGKGNYTGTATAVWRILPGSMTATADDVDLAYDGEAHGIIVHVDPSASGAVVRYGTTRGTYTREESPTLTDAGELTVYWQVSASGYQTVTGTATVTVRRRAAVVTALPQSVALNGSIETGLSAVALSGQVSGHVLSSVSLTGSSTKHAGANGTITPGSATIVDVNSKDVTANYDITYVKGTLTVGKGDAAVTAPVAGTGLVYNGQAQELVKGGGAVGGALQYSLDGKTWSASVPTATDAGEYTVYYRAAESDDYYGTGSLGPVVVRIRRASLKIAADDQRITYGDVPTDGAVTYTGFVNGETEKVLGGELSCNCVYKQYGDVGTYAIEPEGLTSDNYEIVFKPGVLNVLPKTVGLTWDQTVFTYNGSLQGPTATAVGTVNGDAISVIVDGARKDAGTGYVARAAALTGSKAGNYALPSANQKTFSIKKAVWPQANINLDLVYSETNVTASMAGRMPEDAGNLTYDKAGTPSTAGHVEVKMFEVDGNGGVTATLSDGEAGDSAVLPVAITSTNYEDTILYLVVWLIGKEKTGVTITEGGSAVTRMEKNYGDEGFTLNAAADNPGSNGEWEWTSSVPDVADVTWTGGTAEVTVQKCGSTILTARYSSDQTFGLTEVVLTVKPKSMNSAQVSVGGSYIYNGTLQKPADTNVTVYLDGEKLTGGQDYTLETTGGTDAGPVGLTVRGSGNYTGSVSTSFTIARAPLTITTGSAQKAYDGKALINTQKSVSGLVNGETVTVDVTGSQTEVGSSRNNFTVNWGTGTAKESNYKLTKKPGTLEVSKNAVEIILTAASDSKIYDGTALVNASVAATGLPEGFTVNATVEGSQTNAGTCANAIQDGYKILYAAGEDKTANFTKVSRVDGTLTVRPANISGAKVTLNPKELPYTGADQSVDVTEVKLDGKILNKDTDYEVTGVTGKDAGIYTATVTGKGNYTGTATAVWRILSGSMTATADNVTVGYDGQAHGITVHVEPSEVGAVVRYGTTWGTYDLEESPTLTDAGKLTVYWQVSADHYQTVVGSAVITVERAGIKPTVIMEDRTYGKIAKPVVNGNAGDGAVTCLYSDKKDGSYSAQMPSKVGTWWVKAAVDESRNYHLAVTEPVEFRILPAEITITADNISTPYGDGIRELTWQVKGDYVAGDDLGISAVSTAKDGFLIGTYPITISWNGNPNYHALVEDGTYTVTGRKVTVTAIDQSVPQGGSIAVGTGQAKLSGQVSGHTLRAITLTAGAAAQTTTEGTITPSGAVITDAAGNDVTENYIITYQAGTLTVISADSKKSDDSKTATTEEKPALGEDGTAFGKGADAAALDSAIAALKSDDDPKGTRFSPLCLKASKVTKSSVKVTWNKVRGAKEYVVYANASGRNNRLMKVKTTTGKSFTLKKLGGKKLKKGKYYKFMVAALDANGKVITTSKMVHAATKGGKVGNPGSVKTKVKGKKIKLKKGKTYKLNGRAIPAAQKIKIKKIRVIKYETSNPAVATVSSKGVIKTWKKGTCYMYVYAQNGVYKKIRINVS